MRYKGSMRRKALSESRHPTPAPAAQFFSSRVNRTTPTTAAKIVAGGQAFYSSYGTQTIPEFTLARYNSDGSLDSTFGTGGVVSVDTPMSYDFHNQAARCVALQSDGELVVLGSAVDANGNHTFAVATLTASGSLDPAYGGNGWVLGTGNSATSSMSTIGSAANSVLVQQPSDGQIVVTGAVPDSSKGGASDFAVARYIGTTTGPQIGSFTSSGSTVTAGSIVTPTASNITDADPGATITKVTFYYIDGSGTQQVLGTDTQVSGGACTLTFMVNLASGTYTLYAQAEDNYNVLGDPLALTLQVS